MKGAIQGFLSALIAIALLTTAIYFLQGQVEGLVELTDIKIVLALFVLVILLGIVLNWISTYFAVSKYLRIKTDKLYN